MNKKEVATFAAGCFWGVEYRFSKVPGVLKATSGYMGGHLAEPTYEDVCAEESGHAEVVQVEFDPALVSYLQLLEVFWKMHDPTQVNRQGPDEGTQYRTAIFYHSPDQKNLAEQAKAHLNQTKTYRAPVATEITTAAQFWPAEEYHQKYLEKHPEVLCHIS